MKKLNTNICRWGNSRGFRLPKAILDIAGFGDNDRVSLTVDGDAIIIKKATCSEEKRTYPSISERFAAYNGDYVPEEWDTGPAAGKEF